MRFLARMPIDLWRQIRIEAVRQDTTATQLIVTILQEKVDEWAREREREDFSKMMSVRLTPKQEELVERLSERLQCAPVEVLRRGLMKLAREERINGEDTKAN
jgi:hypothetical protein